MRDWFWVWKRWGDSDLTKLELESQLPRTELSEGFDFESTRARGLIRFRYRWEIQAREDKYRIVEEVFVSKEWYLVFSISVLGWMSTLTTFERLTGFFAVLAFFATFLFLILFIWEAMTLTRQDSPIKELFAESENVRELLPVASLFLLLPVGVVIIGSGGGLVPLTGIPSVLLILIGYERYHGWVAEQSFRWQNQFLTWMKQLPDIAANYIATVLLAAVYPIVFIVAHEGPTFQTLVTEIPVILLLFFTLAFGLFLEYLRRVSRKAWDFETAHFQETGRIIESPAAIGITTVAVLGTSVGFGYLSYRFLLEAGHFVQTGSSLPRYGFVVVFGIPVLYFVGGLIYQTYRFAAGTIRLLYRSERKDLSHILDVDADTHVLDHDGIFAGAITLRHHHIIVSQGILDKLEDEHVAAVLAHEEGHIKRGDTILGLLITVLSPLLLTGKNVLYGVLDFRGRELQADQYAVSRLGSHQQVADALDDLQEIKAQEMTDDFPDITPTLLSLDTGESATSFLERVFGFYFGEFALSQVHPSPVQRREQVTSEN